MTKKNLDIRTAKIDEYCYFVDAFNKIKWGKINKIFKEKNKLVFQIICEPNYRYNVVDSEYCSFDEKPLKNIKRR